MASASNAAHSASANPIDSGVPSVPIAMPTVRDTIHTTITAKLNTIIAWMERRAGPSTSSAASMTWAHAVNPKKRPCVHDTPACSPIAAKWMPAAPSSSNAIDHRSTHATANRAASGRRRFGAHRTRVELGQRGLLFAIESLH